MLQRLSDHICRIEQAVAGLCAVLITALIIVNVVTRMLNYAVFWVDEAAVLTMIWMLFLSVAVLLKKRQSIAVTVLVDVLPERLRCRVGVLIDYVVVLFGVLLLIFCWIWFAPLDLVRHGFDLTAFSADTMNFMYQERATTLPIQKFWAWLIIPYFACSVCLHGLANLSADPHGRHMQRTQDTQS